MQGLIHQLSILIKTQAFLHISIIFATFFITYVRILSKQFSWLIDDEGVAKYSEGFSPEKKDPTGKVIEPERIVNTYSCCDGPAKHEVKMLSFNPHCGFPGSILRFLRINIGKKYKIIGTNKNGHEVWGYQQSPRKHHIFNLIVHATNIVLGYFFLRPLIGPDLAFASCLLYSVHPLTTQVVAWISGVMYALSMLFALAVLDTSLYLHDFHFVIPLTILFSFISGITLYLGCFTFIILLFLGFKWAALTSGVVGIFVLFWKGTETKAYRKKAFKDQNMGAGTEFNFRKPVIMVKTIWYYMRLVFLPIQMGLYHIWGYFYEDPIERVNGMFWLGILTILCFIAGFHYGPFPVKLGIVWFFSFIFIFTNFITAQQWVADRYATVPTFGICIIISSVLYHTPVYWVLLGLYMMRTFCHLPTFRNEIDYFLSNFINFRKSEVSLGNLGVAYMNQGMPGTAVDMWGLSTKINPFYDVAWYNLFSIFKANGRLQEAKGFIENCLKAKVVHFKEKWEEELKALDIQMNIKALPESDPAMLLYNEAKSCFEKGDLTKEKEVILKLLSMPTNAILPEMFNGLKERLIELNMVSK